MVIHLVTRPSRNRLDALLPNFVQYIEVRYTEQPRFASRMDLRDVFATNLRRFRNARKLSQDDLAYEAEVSRSYLSQLEKGAFYARLKIVGRLADALHVEPAELLKVPPRTRRR
jgi:DNA-binding XRE family transcriptional regulator